MGFDLGSIADAVGKQLTSLGNDVSKVANPVTTFVEGVPVIGQAVGAAGNFAGSVGAEAEATATAIRHGDPKAAAEHLASTLNSMFPLAHTEAALLTGGNVLDALKADLQTIEAGAKVAAGVFTGNPVAVFNAATNYGNIKRADLVPPVGASYAPSAVDVTGKSQGAQLAALAAVHPIHMMHAALPGVVDAAQPHVAAIARLKGVPLVGVRTPLAPALRGLLWAGGVAAALLLVGAWALQE